MAAGQKAPAAARLAAGYNVGGSWRSIGFCQLGAFSLCGIPIQQGGNLACTPQQAPACLLHRAQPVMMTLQAKIFAHCLLCRAQFLRSLPCGQHGLEVSLCLHFIALCFWSKTTQTLLIGIAWRENGGLMAENWRKCGENKNASPDGLAEKWRVSRNRPSAGFFDSTSSVPLWCNHIQHHFVARSLFSTIRNALAISASYWPKRMANLRLTSLTGARHTK